MQKTKLNLPHFTEVEKVWFSWQGWQVGNQTFADEELEKVDVQEIRMLLREEI